MSPKQKISIVTLGCAKNVADTDTLARMLKARGYDVVSDASDASAVIVHTCSFIESAKKESIEAVLQAGQLKIDGKRLIVTGCLVQQHGDDLFKELPEVDAFLGTGQLAQIPDLLEKPRARFLDRANPGGFMDPDLPLRRDAQGATAYLRLSEGCRHPCTFCVIPRLRGKVQSRSAETILAEVRALVAQGVQELVIIGQDTGDWGRDTPFEGKLPALLKSLAAIPELRWIRLMYMHPASFSEELLTVLADQPEKFPYLDMPLQHIDTAVLAAMKRKTDEPGLRKLIARIRERAPSLTLRTTFIVGFPGETEDQFVRLLHFVREGHFDYLGAFAYSQEEGTPAGRMNHQIPEKIKQERLNALTDAHYGVAHRKAQSRLGTAETVLVEESAPGELTGRTRREAPEIDAIIRLSPKAARNGRFVTARLTAYDAYEFTGDVDGSTPFKITQPISFPV